MAVYTQVSDVALRAFLNEYDVGELRSYKGIAEGVENSNYLLLTNRGQFILTLYEKRVDPKDLPFFLGLLDGLSEKGIPCPVPIHNKAGQALGRLEKKPAAIVSFLEGTCVQKIRRQHCAELGKHLAQMHQAAQDFELSRPNALGQSGWRPLFDQIGPEADTVAPGLYDIIAAELDHLDDHWPKGLKQGIIHADLFPDNVFFIDQRLSGLIDFYFACNDAILYDLAICINAWCFERGGDFNATNARALTTAYQTVSDLPASDMEALPILCRGAAMRFLLTRLYDWIHKVEGALVQPKDPMAYVNRLRFHQAATSPSSYGVA